MPYNEQARAVGIIYIQGWCAIIGIATPECVFAKFCIRCSAQNAQNIEVVCP